MSDPRLDPEAIKAMRTADDVDEDLVYIALDIVKAIAEAPEPGAPAEAFTSVEIMADMAAARVWWKAARALVGGDK